MLKLLDIPNGWFAQFMFKRALDVSAEQMEHQAYNQGRNCLTVCVAYVIIKVTTITSIMENVPASKHCMIDRLNNYKKALFLKYNTNYGNGNK